ncbi:hypothetical protein [Vibrio sonorensis]|uniref:hypothetical protein n=1 Tax=Vibrio sonorensis TaxID=1004316 RepID=UPI0008D9544F|nr:hypothetical protein [Vibrio sonorensis]
MKRDVFGICLSKSMLSNNLKSTFTHVRAYEMDKTHEGAVVKHAFPQLSGEEVLESMQTKKRLVWRAGFCCHACESNLNRY